MEKVNTKLEVKDGIARVTINRPEKRNYLSEGVASELLAYFEELRYDKTIGAVITTATGDVAFCAGMAMEDLKLYYEHPEIQARSSVLKLDETIRNFPKVTIAAVNGYCLGAAITFLCAHDLIIASEEKARFGLPEIARGFPPAYVVAALFRAVAPKMAMELLLTGKNWDARKAQAQGLVNRVVPHAQLHEAAFEWAKEIAQSDHITLEYCKKAAQAVMDEPSYPQALEVNALISGEHARKNPRTQQGLRDFLAGKGVKADKQLD